jgi:hypothetical protein
VPADHADLDGDERRFVSGRVDVYGLQFTDLVALGVDDLLTAPVTQILSRKHAIVLPRASAVKLA